MFILRKRCLLFVCTLLAGAAYSASASEGDDLTLIRDAQSRSFDGADPRWISFAGEETKYQQVRDAGYRYCLREGAVDEVCAYDQDQAIHAMILIILVDDQLRSKEDKSNLTFEERWVAEHPEISKQVIHYCWELYRDHGASDARILSSCLGNLPAFSPLVQLPVFD